MKKLNLYYVYDNVGETCIAGPIPAANDLVAAIGFRDAYINGKNKLPYNYTALDLVRFARFKVDEDGCMEMSCEPQDTCIKRIQGSEIMDFIKLESEQLGLKDNLLDSNVNSEAT